MHSFTSAWCCSSIISMSLLAIELRASQAFTALNLARSRCEGCVPWSLRLKSRFRSFHSLQLLSAYPESSYYRAAHLVSGSKSHKPAPSSQICLWCEGVFQRLTDGRRSDVFESWPYCAFCASTCVLSLNAAPRLAGRYIEPVATIPCTLHSTLAIHYRLTSCSCRY